MKAEELRIGNYVRRLGIKSVVKSITKGSEDVDYVQLINSDVITTNQIEPILLNNKWLKKLGFDKLKLTVNVFYQKENGDFYFQISENNGHFHLTITNHRFDHPDRVGLGVVKYVHELQNLYFAITGDVLRVE